MTKKKIELTITLGEDGIPEDIDWVTADSEEIIKGKAMLLSVFDKAQMDTLKIDLWTKAMQMHEMDRFVYQSIRGITDSYYNATKNAQLANEMQRFCQYFGEKTGIISAESEES